MNIRQIMLRLMEHNPNTEVFFQFEKDKGTNNNILSLEDIKLDKDKDLMFFLRDEK